jgi:hypothetical protein
VFRKVLEALPGDGWDYTPHERSPSARGIAWTMVVENRACADLVRHGVVDWAPPPPPADPDEIRRFHERAMRS